MAVWSGGVALGYWSAYPLRSVLELALSRPANAGAWGFWPILQRNSAVLAVAVSGALTHRLFTLVTMLASGLVFGWWWCGTGLSGEELKELLEAYALLEWVGLWLGAVIGLQGGRLPAKSVWVLFFLATLATVLGAWREASFVAECSG
ncbi:MAG: hypothetical protein Kow00109_15620 [Acidobacteriota bacterium]